MAMALILIWAASVAAASSYTTSSLRPFPSDSPDSFYPVTGGIRVPIPGPLSSTNCGNYHLLEVDDFKQSIGETNITNTVLGNTNDCSEEGWDYILSVPSESLGKRFKLFFLCDGEEDATYFYRVASVEGSPADNDTPITEWAMRRECWEKPTSGATSHASVPTTLLTSVSGEHSTSIPRTTGTVGDSAQDTTGGTAEGTSTSLNGDSTPSSQGAQTQSTGNACQTDCACTQPTVTVTVTTT